MAYVANYKTELGSDQCTTKLVSSIEVVNSDGEVVSPIHNRGTYTYAYLPPNSRVNYEIATYSGGNLVSDEVSIKIVAQDKRYMYQMMDEVLNLASEEQQDEWAEQLANGDSSGLITKASENVDNEKQYKTIYSKTMNTEANGRKKGYITIPDEIEGFYSIVISYGYSGKGQEYSLWDEYAPSLDTVEFIIDIACILFIVVTLGTGTPAVAGYKALQSFGTKVGSKIIQKTSQKAITASTKWTAKAALRKTADRAVSRAFLATMAIGMVTSSISGDIDVNSRGCDFGGGHIHAYGGIAENLDPNLIEFRQGEIDAIYWEEYAQSGGLIGLILFTILVIPKIVRKKRERRGKDDDGK